MFDTVYQFLNSIGYSHPIHPTAIHMPIGLVVGAFIFAIVALVFRREKLLSTPHYCIILAFIWAFPAILFGIMDWQHFYGGAWLFEIKVKLILASLLLVLLLLAIILGHRHGAASMTVLPVYFLCFCVVILLGYFGGQLVYEERPTTISSENFNEGEKVFVANCRGCHPGGGNILKPNLPLKSSPKLKEFESFSNFVQNPKRPDGSRGTMPPFPLTKIPEPEMRDLYKYIVNVLKVRKG